jgi:hypothetical protein
MNIHGIKYETKVSDLLDSRIMMVLIKRVRFKVLEINVFHSRKK